MIIGECKLHLPNIQPATVWPYLTTQLTILRGFRAPLNHINSVDIVGGISYVPVVVHINAIVNLFQMFLVMTVRDEWYFQYAVKTQEQS